MFIKKDRVEVWSHGVGGCRSRPHWVLRAAGNAHSRLPARLEDRRQAGKSLPKRKRGKKNREVGPSTLPLIPQILIKYLSQAQGLGTNAVKYRCSHRGHGLMGEPNKKIRNYSSARQLLLDHLFCFLIFEVLDNKMLYFISIIKCSIQMLRE